MVEQKKATWEKPKLTLKEGNCSFKIIIPQNVEEKIRHICSVIHDVEWSGILFYSHTGSMDDGDFEITCKDLYVMDIGSSAYTEFNESPSILDYRIQNNLLDESIQEGLIHSHNNMATFFSGTDINTLIEEGTNCNHFVSLIVNNEGKYTARVTRKITKEIKAVAHIEYTESVSYDTYGGNKIILSDKEKKNLDKEESKVIQEIEYFNLNIEKQEASSIFTEIDARLREIQKHKSKYSFLSKDSKYPTNTNTKNYGLNSYNKDRYPYSSHEKNHHTEFPATGKQLPLWQEDDYYNYENYMYGEDRDIWNSTPNTMSTSNIKDSKEEELACLVESVDPLIVEDIAAQLITRDFNADTEKLDLKKEVGQMDKLYELKFGPLDPSTHPNVSETILETNNTKLSEWVSSMLDYLLFNVEDPALNARLKIAYGDDWSLIDISEICAMDVWHYLDKMPESYVKNVIMDTLLDYIPNGAKEYISD